MGRKKKWITKVCGICGETFEVTPARKDTAHFCSRECSNKGLSLSRRGENNPAWVGGKIKIVCEVCGKEREFFQSRAMAQRFCSEKCRGIWWSQQQMGENNTCWRDAKIALICKHCGKEFKAYVYGETSQYFCSFECSSATLTLFDPNNPNRGEGRSLEPYPITFNEEFKEMIRQRDNYICAICRLSGKDIHHINYIKEDTVPENCITLCHGCHSVTNFNRDYWQVKLEDLQQIRLGV